MSKSKRLFILAGIVVLVAAIAGGWLLSRKSASRDELVLYGNVDLRQVSLAFNGNDRVAKLTAQEGDRVKAGQVLGELDTTLLTLRVAQARAQADAQQQILQRLQAGNRPEEIAQAHAGVAAAQADAELAGQQLDRLRAIRESTAARAISQQDLDAAQARHKVALAALENARKTAQLAKLGPRKEDIAQAQAQFEAAKATLALLNQQLADAKLKAPIDAVVRARLLEPGDMASPQRPAYTLAVIHPKWVRAYVAEADLGHIKPGMPAEVRIDSAPATPIAGRIGYIASVAEFTPKTVQTEELRSSLVYEVRVLVDDQADRLRLGMPATIRIFLSNNAPRSSGS